jgi:hypothetical protein
VRYEGIGVGVSFIETEKKISLKAKVLDAWNSMSEWNNTVTVASHKPGGDRLCPVLVNNCRTNRLNCASSSMNDCRCRERSYVSNVFYMLPIRMRSDIPAPEDIIADILLCAGYWRRVADNACVGICTGK